MSGHNRWSSIKHKKGAKDAKRGARFSKIIKEITIAARMGGGDPSGNPRLRRTLDEARMNNMPADNITRAIKKGTGELEGITYEELLYEGVGPSGVLVMIEVVTDNRNRTAAEIRKIFDRHHGVLSSAHGAAWAFDHKGVIRLPASAATEEQLFDVAGDAGAEDIRLEGDDWIVTTAREALDAVSAALEKAKLPAREARLEHVAKTPKIVGGHDGEVLIGLLEALDDHDDVQHVYSEFVPSDELLAQLAT